MIATRGFSLIESLVYIGLLAILMTGTLVSAYAMNEFSLRYRSAARLEQEGTFLLRSVLWSAQSGTITYPLSEHEADSLSIRDEDGKTVTFEKNDRFLTVSIDGRTHPLSAYPIETFRVRRTGIRSDPFSPENVSVSLVLTSHEDRGQMKRTFNDSTYTYGEE